MHRIKVVLVTAFIALGLSAPAVAQISMSSVATAFPLAVVVGVGGTIGSVHLAVLRGLVNSPQFDVEVTVTDQGSGQVTAQTTSLSEASVFSSAQSQSLVVIDFGSSVPITAGELLDVCATVIQTTPAGDRVFSQEICTELDPQ